MIGTKLAHYEITAHLGSGGMGEVYQASDSKLGRTVAIKFLPEAFTHDGDRVARFQREARVLASLNHPNVAAIYGVEETNGRHFLVMELVPGETLEERIRRGALPLKDALPVAKQIAEALEEAHEAGIVHRDLKPANIKITADDKVKVLDFGLAKTAGTEQSNVSLSMSPTLSPTVVTAATSAGVIMGTAPYMSPEQARGRTVDRRTDIWAFGVVLFRMLSGTRMFEGETVTDTLAKILEREPEWEQLPADTPPALRQLLQRCLTKNPKNRLQSIGDARILIQELIEKPQQPERSGGIVERTASPWWMPVLPWATAVVCLAGGAVLWMWRPAPAPDRPSLQFEYPLPAGYFLQHANRHAIEVSPDGRRVAFIAATPGMPPRIFVRSLNRSGDTPIAGTEGAANVTFSPDGESLAFQQGSRLKKVTLAGGAPTVVLEGLAGPGAFGPPGITWGPDGTIVLASTLGTGLGMVRDTGGKSEEFTTLDQSAHEASHRLPHFLPDGSGVLFTVIPYSAVAPDWSRAQVWVKSLKSGKRTRLIEDAVDAQYAGNNTLVFARRGKLFAIGFDPSSLSVSGREVQVLDDVTHSVYGTAGTGWTGAAQFSVSATGDLFYAPGSVEPPLLTQLVWFDRTGNPTPITGTRDMFRFAPRVLPDGVRVAFSELYLNKDVWFVDTARGIEDRATFEGQNAFPIHARTGSRFAFRSDRNGPQQIFLNEGVNLREAKQLTSGPFDVPSSWTPDGKELLFTRGYTSLGGNTDIYAVSIDQPDKIRPVVATPADERAPEISPDGKWLAYTSNDSGNSEVYVQPYPGPGPRVTVTNGGAVDPAWSKNSNELFYMGPGGAGKPPAMNAVPFTLSGTSFVPGRPVVLFNQNPLGGGTTVRATYDVSPDGRFLMNQPIAAAAEARARRLAPTSLRFIMNWTQEVQRLLSPR
jgi:eukaryotic-like serine/threonine-protein kinase